MGVPRIISLQKNAPKAWGKNKERHLGRCRIQGGKIMRIQSNISAINTQRQMFKVNNAQSKSMERLSSGFRINRAADDAAGLAISEKMRSQIRGMRQASRNAQDGISVVQTAEGALDEVHDMLQRMKELAVQAANDSNQSLVDREALQLEVDQLTDEINSITDKTQFNKMNLLDGTFTNKHFHVGANSDQSIGISIKSMTAEGLGLKTGGTEELVSSNGQTRVLEAKGFQNIKSAAQAIKKGSALVFEDVATKFSDATKKAKFRVAINDKYGEFEVGVGSDGKIKKEDIAKAAREALNRIAGETLFTGTGEKVSAIDAIKSFNGITGAYAKVEMLNEGDFNIGTAIGKGISMKDAVMGTELGAKVDISHEVGKGHYEISINGQKPITVDLTKDDDTADKIKAKFSAALAGLVGTVSYSVAAGGRQGVIRFKTKKSGNEATIKVRATGASGFKQVDYKGVNILTRDAANKSMNNVQAAIEQLSSRRAELGAIQNRVEHTIANLNNSVENLTASEARIRDTDMAAEIIESSRTSILSQAAISMLSQANQVPQNILSLLR